MNHPYIESLISRHELAIEQVKIMVELSRTRSETIKAALEQGERV